MQRLFSVSLILLSINSYADAPVHDEESEGVVENITVYGQQFTNYGEAISASEGHISQGEIEQRPILRAGEILEFVPGMVVTQHSGSGKANQYYLRGFNLDHGTDFRTTIDGMPINMRTHGHGQGYTDLSFIVPEFIGAIEYQKGPYHAEEGDFSTAGSAQFQLINELPQGIAQLEIGEDQYLRTVLADQLHWGKQSLLLGLETQTYDGPWIDIDEDVEKYNLLLRYRNEYDGGRYHLTLMGYDNQWNSADQIPQRAITQGLIDRLGSLDDSVGGESERYSLSLQWQHGRWLVDAYAITSELNLFSNFTYFLEDPINGDQFEQVDDRSIYGGQVQYGFVTTIGDNHIHHKVGWQFRYDDIQEVALYKTALRQRLSTVRQDSVDEYSHSLFWQGEIDLTEVLSANIGIRYDYFDVEVNSDLAANSGDANDGLVNFKAGIQYEFSPHWQGFLNVGQSFHSNDARGATIQVDPSSGEAATPVDLLVQGEGVELGAQFIDQNHLNLSATLWLLELDSELLFVGDAGNTEAGRASRRQGIEITGYYWLNEDINTDIELAWSHARFTESAIDEGDRIEGALPFVASIGVNWRIHDHWRANLRLRHFGERTLDSFDIEQSEEFTVVNLGVTYQYQPWEVTIKALNLFDSTDHDIDYFYASRLENEPAGGIEDRHFHPIEPRTLRMQIRYSF